jgi:hypothetical protein
MEKLVPQGVRQKSKVKKLLRWAFEPFERVSIFTPQCTIGLLFDFCWRSLRFALTTQKAVSHGPLPRLLSAVEVTPHGPPTQVSMATPRKLSKIKADYYR